MNDVVYAKGKDGYTRYYAGAFKTIEEATAYKVELITLGYANAFVVAYDEGERKTLIEAGVNVSENYNEEDEKKTFVEPRKEKAKINYKVYLGEFEGNLQTDMVELFLEIGGIQNEPAGATTKYYSKNYSSIEAAEAALNDILSKGLEDAKVVGDIDGKTVTKEEAQKKAEEQK